MAKKEATTRQMFHIVLLSLVALLVAIFFIDWRRDSTDRRDTTNEVLHNAQPPEISKQAMETKAPRKACALQLAAAKLNYKIILAIAAVIVFVFFVQWKIRAAPSEEATGVTPCKKRNKSKRGSPSIVRIEANISPIAAETSPQTPIHNAFKDDEPSHNAPQDKDQKQLNSQLLKNANISPIAAETSPQTPIHNAFKDDESSHNAPQDKDQKQLNSQLLKNANISPIAAETSPQTPIHNAFKDDESLHNSPQDEHQQQLNSQLLASAYIGDYNTLVDLIAKGADVNATDNGGETSLMWAAQNGCIDCVKLLVKKGAHIYVIDKDGDTALTLSAWKGHVNIVKYLVQQRATINVVNNDGETAISLAKARSTTAHQEIAAYLEEQAKIQSTS